MSTAREGLLARYRARSLERLRQVGLVLVELEAGRGDEAMLRDVARELHTLKGDARVVGHGTLSELFHRIEDVLLAQGATPSPDVVSRLRTVLDGASQVLRDALEDTAAEDVLAVAQIALASLPVARADAPPPTPSTPTPPPTPAPAAAPAMAGNGSERRFRLVDTLRVDHASERTLELSAEFNALAAQLRAAGVDRRSLELLDRCRTRLDEVVDATWSLRLVPVAPSLEELVVPATTLATQLGKRVRVQLEAHGTEVERAVLDDLLEPLLHLVRNAIDHGLETPAERGEKGPEGQLWLRASVVGASLRLEVSDDGRGVDFERVMERALELGLVKPGAELTREQKLDLLFQHGFSTRSSSTDVSGRGVGLDVVRSRVDALGGQVAVSQTGPSGTTLTLTVPTALSRETALVVQVGGRLYGVPAAQVQLVHRLEPGDVEAVAGGRVLRRQGTRLALQSLATVLDGAAPRTDERWVVVLSGAQRQAAFTVEQVLGQRELVRRPIDAVLATIPALSGSALLEDGRLVLLLVVAALLRKETGAAAAEAAPQARVRPRILVVDDSLTVCNLMSQLLTEGGFDVTEAHDGLEALEVLADGVPALVVTDIDMPRMDGFTLLGRVRERWPHLPVAMLSMRGSPEDRRRAASLGANAYLVKSQFDETTLAETVRRLLGGR